MKHTIAVLGLGVFGKEAARQLARSENVDVIVFDRDDNALATIAPKVPRAIVTDVTQTRVLEAEGAEHWWAAIIALRRHFDSTVLVAHYLRRKMAKEAPIIALVNSTEEEAALKALGVSRVVFPERDVAGDLVKALVNPGLEHFFDLGPDVDMGEHTVPSSFAGKTLKELDIRSVFGLHAVAVHHLTGQDNRGGEVWSWEVPPNPSAPLAERDRLLLIGSPRALAKFVVRFPADKP